MLLVFSQNAKVRDVLDTLQFTHYQSRMIYDWTAIYSSTHETVTKDELIALRTALYTHQSDVIQVQSLLDPKKLTQFAFDMDSTIIKQEVIDELARLHGVYDEISAVTREAMEGNLDFKQALHKRCGLLKGLPITVFDELYETLQLNEGVKELLSSFKKRRVVSCIFSGGFIPILNRFQKEYGITEVCANQLEVSAGILTGHVLGDIVDKHKKRDTLLAIQKQYNIDTDQTVAVGDGANDSLMIQAAAIGIGFHAKDGLKKLIGNWIDFAPMYVLESLFKTES